MIPFNRDARMFDDGVPIFPNSAGIRTDKLALQMAEAMGDHYAVFLKGHGIVVSERTIEARRSPRFRWKELRAINSCSCRSVSPCL